MSSVLNNIVTVRKTRGDVLNPAQFRSIYEMITGILAKYDFAGFNTVYKELLAHLVNYDDPHDVTSTSFYPEVLERIYTIYSQMTPTPLSYTDFQADLITTPAFFELIRRIVLNHYLYTRIKNPDGSVNASVSMILNEDWGHSVYPNVPVTINFGRKLADETAFINLGITTNTAPIPVVFNALDLTIDTTEYVPFFHTSRASPTYGIGGTTSGTMVSLFEASNDFVMDLKTKGVPSTTTTVLTMTNGTNVLTLSYSPAGALSLKLDANALFTNVACTDGKSHLKLTKAGQFTLLTSANSIITTSTVTLDLSTIRPFTIMQLMTPVESPFDILFSVRSLTLSKVSKSLPVPPKVLSIVLTTPASMVTPITGSSSGSSVSPVLIATGGYDLYLTLSGTWTGTVTVQVSHDGGVTWSTLSDTYGGNNSVYTQNCDEAVTNVLEDGTRFRVVATLTSGTVSYRLAI